MNTTKMLKGAALLTALVLAGCSTKKEPQAPVRQPADVKSQIQKLLPSDVSQKSAWADDIYTAFRVQQIDPSASNVCAVIAVTDQESNFSADAPVPGLPKIAWGEIDRRAAKVHVPAFLVRTALLIKSPTGESYAARLDKVRSEKELSAIFDDFIDMVPMGQKLFGNLNPIHTGGPMQVSIEFAEAHAKGYPYSIDGSIRREVFTRRGGIYFGTLHLLGYPADYSQMLYRFADFNAGWYASRNAAFQAAVARASGIKLALDGDLIMYGSEQAGSTELAVRTLSKQLDMSNREIRRDLEKGDTESFSSSTLWKQTFILADKMAGKRLPREMLPGIKLESPKITRNLTTAWFAQRVNGRYQQCLTRR
jgi:outer membrane murein-binding lipoprotein Lpp